MAPVEFEGVVMQLVEDGCSLVRVDDIVARWRAGTPLPARAVALTFDDAYESVHCVALPLLASFGVPATVFPVTSQLGGHNEWDAGRGSRTLELMGEAQLRELVAAGWEVGGHGHTHRSLPGLTPAEVLEEVVTSNAVLEQACGLAPRTFAYPYGNHDPATRALVASHYDACLTIGASRATAADPLDRLPRVEAWYLRRPWQVRAIHGPAAGLYLLARRGLRAAGRATRR